MLEDREFIRQLLFLVNLFLSFQLEPFDTYFDAGNVEYSESESPVHHRAWGANDHVSIYDVTFGHPLAPDCVAHGEATHVLGHGLYHCPSLLGQLISRTQKDCLWVSTIVNSSRYHYQTAIK